MRKGKRKVREKGIGWGDGGGKKKGKEGKSLVAEVRSDINLSLRVIWFGKDFNVK